MTNRHHDPKNWISWKDGDYYVQTNGAGMVLTKSPPVRVTEEMGRRDYTLPLMGLSTSKYIGTVCVRDVIHCGVELFAVSTSQRKTQCFHFDRVVLRDALRLSCYTLDSHADTRLCHYNVWISISGILYLSPVDSRRGCALIAVMQFMAYGTHSVQSLYDLLRMPDSTPDHLSVRDFC